MSESNKITGLINVQRTGDQHLRHLKALVCGDPGTGKTLMAATAPDPFIINTDHGLASLRHLDVPFASVPDTKDDIKDGNVSKFIGEMLAILGGSPETQKKHLGVAPRTVIIDTYDMIVALLIKEYLKAQGQTAMKIQDYGWLKERLKALTAGFRNLDMHVIFTCHLKEKSDEDGSNPRILPAIDGGFSEEIAGWVDIAVVLRNEVVTEVVDNKMNRRIRKYMQTFPEPPRLNWVKDRFGVLPQEFDLNLQDDFTRIYDLVYGDAVASSVEATDDTNDQAA
jgi:hypothetical protein